MGLENVLDQIEGFVTRFDRERGRDPGLYYEDGFQEYADRGGHVGVAPIGAVDWAEVDDHRDLERAREIACRC